MIDKEEVESKKLQAQLEEIYVEQFWKPCTSKAMLQQWLKTYLNVDLPDNTNSRYSNSNPIDFLWAVYHSALTGDVNSTSFVVAAARNSSKCLVEGTQVATLSGPKPIEKVLAGDTVFDQFGKPIKVVGLWDQGEQEVFELISDGKVIATCTKNHIWSTYTSWSGGCKDTKVEDFTEETYIVRSPFTPQLGKKFNSHAYYIGNNQELSRCFDISEWNIGSISAFIAGVYDACGEMSHKYVNVKNLKDLGISVNFLIENEVFANLVADVIGSAWQITPEVIKTKKGFEVYMTDSLSCLMMMNHIFLYSRYHREIQYLLDNNAQYLTKRHGYKIDEVRPVGKRKCWDLTVYSRESLYCLQNGAVTHNTLCAAVLEFLMMVHFGRDIAHIAAQVQQSAACIDYLDMFLNIPIIAPYKSIDSKRQKTLKKMPTHSQKPVGYSRLKVVTATKKGANSSRASVMIFDEVDQIEREILSEAAMIADPDRTGKPTIFVYLSSRKSAIGPIQEKIDQAAIPNSRIKLHKWNVMEWMQPCPPEVHKPELPIDLYVHQETLQVIPSDDYEKTSKTEKELFEQVPAYEGCRTCPVFTVCRTDAIKQQSKTPRLRTKEFYADLLSQLHDPEVIIAQIMNLKPESSGTVFNKFDERIHVGDFSRCWKFAFGEDQSNQLITKSIFIHELRSRGWKMHCGVDFGYVDPAVSVLVAFHKPTGKLVVLHTERQTGYSNQEWLQKTKENIFIPYGFDLLCPDVEDKSSPIVAAQLGMPSIDKKPSRIETGVSWLRGRLWNVSSNQPLFMILDDNVNKGQHFLINSLKNWQYMKTALGFDFTKFMDDMNTHEIDALRYATAPFIASSNVVLSVNQDYNTNNRPAPDVLTVRQEIAAHYKEKYGLNIDSEVDDSDTIRSGNIIITF